MWNRFETYQPSQYVLPKVNLDVLSSVLQAKQARFDTGLELADKISSYGIEALPQDRARANALIQEWDTRKQKIVDSYQGDYASAYRDLRMLGRDIEKQLKPGGEAAAIIGNKAAFTDWYKKSQDRLGKEINANQLEAAYNYYMNENSKGYFKGTSKDPVTGAYSTFNPEDIINYVNPDDVVLPAIKQLEASGFEMEYDKLNGDYIMRNKESGEELTMEEISNTAYRSMVNHPNMLSSVSQLAKFKNMDQFDPMSYASDLASSYGQDFAYNKTKRSETIHANQVALHYDKEARKDARHKELLKQYERAFSPERSTLDYTPSTPGKPLSTTDFTGNTFKGPISGKWSNILRGPAAQLAGVANYGYQALTTGPIGVVIKSAVPALKYGALSSNKEWGKRFMSKIIESGDFEAKGGNLQIMRAVMNDAEEQITGDELLSRYNKALKEVGSKMQPSAKSLSYDEGVQVAKEMFESSKGQYTTIKVMGENGRIKPINYQDFVKEYKKDLFDDKGKYIGPALQTVVEATSGLAPSFVFKVNGGKTTVYMEAPPAYTRAMAPVTTLAEAYTSPSGRSKIPGLPNLALPHFDEEGKPTIKSWEDTPLELVVEYVKGPNGYEPVPKLYEYPIIDEQTGTRTVQEAHYTVMTPEGPVQVPLTIEDIHEGIDQNAWRESFGRITEDSKNTYWHGFGDKIRINN